MKKELLVILGLILFSQYSFADGERVFTVDSNSPKIIEAKIDVKYTTRSCSNWDTRQVYGQDSSCGFDTRWERECDDVCVARDSDGYCSREEYRCENVPREVTRSCYHPQSYCAEYDYSTYKTQAAVFIRVKKHDNALKPQNFTIKVDQYGYDKKFRFSIHSKDKNLKVKVRENPNYPYKMLGKRARFIVKFKKPKK